VILLIKLNHKYVMTGLHTLFLRTRTVCERLTEKGIRLSIGAPGVGSGGTGDRTGVVPRPLALVTALATK
jgi:hypothetical protein